jgi:hypothetical protein
MKLYVTYCSAEKREGIHPPDVLYISARITRFIARCRDVGVNWAILSALHAFFFPEQKRRNYNVTMQTDERYWLGIAIIKDGRKLSYTQSKQHILKLAKKLKQQAKARMIKHIIFYGPSPMMMKCYLGILHHAFDGCLKTHGWQDLIKHVKAKSRVIKVIHRINSIC